MASVYLLHLDPPYRHARHYLGCAKYLEKRIEHHRKGSGANLCAVAVANGSELKLARVWKNAGFELEHRLKRHKNSPRLCPFCNPHAERRGKISGQNHS